MPPVTESEVLTASEAMRGMMDYYAHATSTSAILERLAGLQPSMLACQHGSAYRGDSATLLRELSATIERGNGKVSALLPAVTAIGGLAEADRTRIFAGLDCPLTLSPRRA
jgi:hypothetical protein